MRYRTLLPHSRYEVDARIGNHRKKILSLPKCGWKPSGRTRVLGTSGNNEEGESEMDGGISVQYRNVLPTVITGSIAVTRHSSHYSARFSYLGQSFFSNLDDNLGFIRDFPSLGCDSNCHRIILAMKITVIVIVVVNAIV